MSITKFFYVSASLIVILALIGCDELNNNGGGGTTGSYTCQDGTPVDGSPDGEDDVEECDRCDSGYTLVGVQCISSGKITASDAAEEDEFGYAVSINNDGTRAIIGAPRDDGEAVDAGSAYIFERRDNAWSQEGLLTPSDAAAGDEFGYAVAIDDNAERVVVGAYKDDDGGEDSGSVYIFSRSGSEWTEEQRLSADTDAAAGDEFGYAVAIDGTGTRVVVGSYKNDDSEDNTGSVYIFTRGEGGWSQEEKLTASDGEMDDQFGVTVAIDSTGERVIIGANGDDDTAINAGSAYIFTRTDTTWSREQKITDTEGSAGDQFGRSVSIDDTGERVIIGAHQYDGGLSSAGSIYIFTRSETTWEQEGKLTADDRARDDQFGISVDIDGSGERVIIGAHQDDDGGRDAGSVYIFTRSETTWTEDQKITAADRTMSDIFGWAVAINGSGDRVIVGAYQDDDGGSSAGSAYIYSIQ